jgi:hypothetical protein
MKKKRKKSNLWIYYWIFMAVMGVGIIGMVIFLVTRKPAEVAVAPTQPEATNPANVRPKPAADQQSKPAEAPAQRDATPPRQEEATPPRNNPITETETPPKQPDVTPKRPDLPTAEEASPTNPTPEPKPVEPTVAMPGIEKGNQVLEIEANDLQGKKFKLSDYRGKVVLLDFWGFW